MLLKSPLVVKNPDLDAQIRFMFEVPTAPVRAEFTVPPFWKYGVFTAVADVPAAKREEERKHLVLQRKIAEEELALARFEEDLKKEEIRYLAEIDSRRDLYRKKEEELELLNQKAMLERRAALLKKEAEIKRIEQENAVLNTDLENQKRLAELRLQHETAEQALIDDLTDMDTAIAKAETRGADLQSDLNRAKADLLDRTGIELRERQANETRVFEAYDPRNILEVKEVYLYNVIRERCVLYLPTMSVRKGKVTVMTSKDAEILLLAYKTLFRAYGTNYSIRSGEIRIDGVATTAHLKTEFRKSFGAAANASTDFFDLAAHSDKNALKTFSFLHDEARFRSAATTLGLDPALLKKPLKKVSERDRETLATAAALLSDTELTALIQPFRKDDPRFNEGFMRLLETRPDGKAYLILTAETDLCLRLSEFALYRLD